MVISTESVWLTKQFVRDNKIEKFDLLHSEKNIENAINTLELK